MPSPPKRSASTLLPVAALSLFACGVKEAGAFVGPSHYAMGGVAPPPNSAAVRRNRRRAAPSDRNSGGSSGGSSRSRPRWIDGARIPLLADDDDDSEIDGTRSSGLSGTETTETETTDHLDLSIVAPLAALAGCTVLLGSTLYSLATNPAIDFDVDFYMALDRTLDGVGGGGGVGSNGLSEIVELPTLSPAEQIVGAFFGPPRR